MRGKHTALSLVLLAACAGPLFGQMDIVLDTTGFQLHSIGPYLEDAKNPDAYAPKKLFDGQPQTCWAIGNGGPGVKLFVAVPEGARELRFQNGFAKSKDLFSRNNRVKSAKVSLYAAFSFPHRVSELGRVYTSYPIAAAKAVTLRDESAAQSIPLLFDWAALGKEREKKRLAFDSIISSLSDLERDSFSRSMLEEYVLCFEIAEVYKGSKWNDTCMSELSFVPESRSIPHAKKIVGFWETVRGSDAEQVDFQEDGTVYSYLGTRPFANGTWKVAEDLLRIQWEGFPESEQIYSPILTGKILQLINTDGTLEVYERGSP